MKPYRLPRCRVLAVACVLVCRAFAGCGAVPAAAGPDRFERPAVGCVSASPRLSRIRCFRRHRARPGVCAYRCVRAWPVRPHLAVFHRRAPGLRCLPAADLAAGGGPGPSDAQRVCLNFPTIREDVEKSAALIKTASERKATREEVCPLFKTFAAKEGKMISVPGNQPETLRRAAQDHRAGEDEPRQHHAHPQRPYAAPVRCRARRARPTLSDALGGPIIADDTSAKQPGRGTFDTLTGNALQQDEPVCRTRRRCDRKLGRPAARRTGRAPICG